MTTTTHSIEAISSNPQIRGGRPVMTGTSIRVSDIVASHIYRGLAAEELAVNFDLDLGQIYAALAYYYLHKPDIDAELRANAAAAEALLAEFDAAGKVIRIE